MLVKFIIDGQQFEVDDQEELRIDSENIDKERVRFAVRKSWFATASAQYSVKKDELYHQLKVLKSMLFKEYKEKKGVDGKLPSDSTVENLVLADERYSKLLSEYFVIGDVAGKLSAIVDAFNDKKDMLLEISRDRRREMDLEVSGGTG